MLKQERVFRISGNNKGLMCPFKPILCQEGYCNECQIHLDWLSMHSVQSDSRLGKDETIRGDL